jgi:hypothetical protein
MKPTYGKNGYTYNVLETDKGLYFASVSDPSGQVVGYECGRIAINYFDGKPTQTIARNSKFGTSQADMYVPARLKRQCWEHFNQQRMQVPG